MEHLGFNIEVEWLWLEDRQSRFKDSIMPNQLLIHMFLFILCGESRYFEGFLSQLSRSFDPGCRKKC